MESETTDDVPLISLRQLGVEFSRTGSALRGTDLSLRRGEIVAVVGPPGSGKSTLLGAISGVIKPTSGSVVVSTTRMTLIPWSLDLLPNRTVRRNVELLLELEQVAAVDRQLRVDQAIDITGLGGFENAYPKDLSRRSRLLVSLARTIAYRPELLLLDDPFGMLSDIARSNIFVLLLDVVLAQRLSVLIVTVSIPDAVFLSQRVLVMSRRPGSIVAEVPVPFGYPRVPSITYSDEFRNISAEVARLVYR